MAGRSQQIWLMVPVLIGVTALWGWTFVVVRDAVSTYPVLPFLVLRFGLAALVLSPAALRSTRALRSGIAPGVALAVGYLAQTEGLRYTTASKAGLLTGLFVVITPVLYFGLGRQRPPGITTLAVPAALLGTVLLAGRGAATTPREALGDGLEVLTALAFSVHILLLARVPRDVDLAGVALGQMTVALAIFSVCAAVGGNYPAPSWRVWSAAAVTGVLASALAFWVQTAAQQHISPQRTAIVLTCEPAFATAFGVLLAGDRFSSSQAAGAAIILVAVVVHELWPVLNGRRQSGGS